MSSSAAVGDRPYGGSNNWLLRKRKWGCQWRFAEKPKDMAQTGNFSKSNLGCLRWKFGEKYVGRMPSLWLLIRLHNFCRALKTRGRSVPVFTSFGSCFFRQMSHCLIVFLLQWKYSWLKLSKVYFVGDDGLSGGNWRIVHPHEDYHDLWTRQVLMVQYVTRASQSKQQKI